jgi:ferritin-like metal-binding protein YciE
MASSEQKVVQYLGEARASELALVRVLQSQLAMTPPGPYRTALREHQAETRRHAERVGRRLTELGHARNPVLVAYGAVQMLAGQALALAKTPLDLVRGTSVAEKILKNAKDTCATEALEIATYAALERLAESAGDQATATLAAEIRAEEVRMLERVRSLIPALTDAVSGARPPAAARAASSASSEEPWPGYDQLPAAKIVSLLDAEADPDRGARVEGYEREHKNRVTVLRAAARG